MNPTCKNELPPLLSLSKLIKFLKVYKMTQYGPYENLIQRGRGIQSMLQGSWQKGHILNCASNFNFILSQ